MIPATYNYQNSNQFPLPKFDLNLDMSGVQLAEFDPKIVPLFPWKKSLYIASDGLYLNASKIGISFKETSLIVFSFIGDPLGVGYVDTMNLDILKIQGFLASLGQQIETINEMVTDQGKRIDALYAALENSSGSSLEGILSGLSMASMFLSPLIGLAVQGLVLVISLSEMVANGTNVQGIVNTIINVVMFAITARAQIKVFMTKEPKLDQYGYMWSSTVAEVKNPISEVISNGETISVGRESALKTVQVISRYTPISGLDGKYASLLKDIQLKIEMGTASPLEKSWFDVHAKLSLVPMHQYMAVVSDDISDVDLGYTRTIHILGVADGNSVPTDGMILGSGKIRIGEMEASSPGFLRIKLKMPKGEAGQWGVASWQEAGMTKQQIMDCVNASESGTDFTDDEVTDVYNSVVNEYLKDLNLTGPDAGVYETADSSPMRVLKGQMEALEELIDASKRNYSYRLIGNNCQTFFKEMEGLLKFNRRPGRWVRDEDYNNYLRAIYNRL